MMSYLISLGAGLVVGLLYYFSRVQSPAPPLVALIGLLGIVVGEHAIPVLHAQWRAPQTQNADASAANAADCNANSKANSNAKSDSPCNSPR